MMEKASRACSFLPRLLALVAAAAATVVMATSHESTTVFNISVEAKFSYTPAFEFFVIANAIGAIYSLLALFVPQIGCLSRLLLAFDVVVTMLLTAAVSAAVAVGEVGKKGNVHSGWLPICDTIPKFCDQARGAMICGFVAVLLYLIILLHAIHKFNQLLL